MWSNGVTWVCSPWDVAVFSLSVAALSAIAVDFEPRPPGARRSRETFSARRALGGSPGAIG